MGWSKWFAWYPVHLRNNDHAKISGEPRWVWLKLIYKRRIYVHIGGMYGIDGYDVYSDIEQ